ncbi:MAG TPA: SDR family NAD(P)-dependent oxidoreductase [Kofleriaceae bacterium]|nr:SDR family NAD(P)-dependent oxidoreductase [Kofleriaceae bacterium]
MVNLTALVTGATGGLGELVAEQLVRGGARVIVHGRTRAHVEPVAARLGMRGVVADLSSLAEVVQLAREVGEVDLLVNNAGVGFGHDQMHREVSRDGFELRFAVNYLAPYVLTHALLDRVRAVVQVASIGQRALDFEDLMMERDYDGIVAYRRSKLALVTHAFALAAAQRVPINSLHPGTFLDTDMVRESGITPQGTARAGAEAIRFVIDRTLDGVTGTFFDQYAPARADPQAYIPDVRRRLLDRTRELVEPWLQSEPRAHA